jgi:hypothetical protein
MSEDNQEVLKERERIEGIVELEVKMELKNKINNPDNLSKKQMRVKANYVKGRLEHLERRILFKINNPNYVRQSKDNTQTIEEQMKEYRAEKGLE